MNIKIKTANEEDLPKILEIEQKTFTDPWVKSQFKECLTSESKYIYFAMINSDIAGYIVFEHVLDEGHLSNLAVKNEYQKKGVGSELVKHILVKAGKIGLKFLMLEVRVSNEKARNFYAKLGFKEIGTRKMYYKDPVEDALMLKFEILR